ncbi:uncharacterized protein LOC133906095 [Phragmites australis]|uniref:uncharacterized protein LOC133906095 n=1 Tax=Phragmites australis TaxID=29695 RepID=UPI002D768D85|nr:uncharacterized protein LOC133906095 [Phragmites australis]
MPRLAPGRARSYRLELDPGMDEMDPKKGVRFGRVGHRSSSAVLSFIGWSCRMSWRLSLTHSFMHSLARARVDGECVQVDEGRVAKQATPPPPPRARVASWSRIPATMAVAAPGISTSTSPSSGFRIRVTTVVSTTVAHRHRLFCRQRRTVPSPSLGFAEFSSGQQHHRGRRGSFGCVGAQCSRHRRAGAFRATFFYSGRCFVGGLHGGATPADGGYALLRPGREVEQRGLAQLRLGGSPCGAHVLISHEFTHTP